MQRNLWEEFKNAFKKSNNGLIQLILINGIVFFVLRVLEVILTLTGFINDPTVYHQTYLNILGLPSDLGQLLLRPWTFITTFFTHYGFFHILFNMLFLYWFGRLVLDYLGNGRLISLYILGGLAGGILYILIYNLSPLFVAEVGRSSLIGASASVFAIVVGAATLMPDHQFYLLLLGPVRIKYIAIFYVGMSFFGAIGSNAGGDIAHLGGALLGFIYIKQLQKGNDLGSWVQSGLDFFRSFFVRPKVKVTHRNTARSRSKTRASQRSKATTSGSSAVPQEEIDAILDKISAKGYESLTKEEKQKLFNASR
jgi:membrane associated rhomboid family serine protease